MRSFMRCLRAGPRTDDLQETDDNTCARPYGRVARRFTQGHEAPAQQQLAAQGQECFKAQEEPTAHVLNCYLTLEDKLRRLQCDHSDILHRDQVLAEACQGKREESAELREQLGAAIEELASAESRIDGLASSHNQLEDKHSSLAAEHSNLLTTNAQLVRKLGQARRAARQSGSQLAAAHTRLDHLEAIKSRLEASNSRLKASQRHLRAANRCLRSSLCLAIQAHRARRVQGRPLTAVVLRRQSQGRQSQPEVDAVPVIFIMGKPVPITSPVFRRSGLDASPVVDAGMRMSLSAPATESPAQGGASQPQEPPRVVTAEVNGPARIATTPPIEGMVLQPMTVQHQVLPSGAAEAFRAATPVPQAVQHVPTPATVAAAEAQPQALPPGATVQHADQPPVDDATLLVAVDAAQAVDGHPLGSPRTLLQALALPQRLAFRRALRAIPESEQTMAAVMRRPDQGTNTAAVRPDALRVLRHVTVKAGQQVPVVGLAAGANPAPAQRHHLGFLTPQQLVAEQVALLQLQLQPQAAGALDLMPLIPGGANLPQLQPQAAGALDLMPLIPAGANLFQLQPQAAADLMQFIPGGANLFQLEAQAAGDVALMQLVEAPQNPVRELGLTALMQIAGMIPQLAQQQQPLAVDQAAMQIMPGLAGPGQQQHEAGIFAPAVVNAPVLDAQELIQVQQLLEELLLAEAQAQALAQAMVELPNRLGQIDGLPLVELSQMVTTDTFLGRGGFGTVNLGGHNGGPVAIKMIILKDAFNCDGFILEVQVMVELTQLGCPELLPILGAGVIPGEGAFIVLPLMAGSLDFMCSPRYLANIPANHGCRVLVIMLAAARGLRAIHQSGRLHGDFKPLNVLHGFDEQVQISDFGTVIKLWNPALPDGGLVEDDQGRKWVPGINTNGTPVFMPPEAYSVDGVCCTTRDSWAWGISLLQLWCGQLPYHPAHLRLLELPNAVHLFCEGVRDDVIRPEIPGTLPGDVREICDRALPPTRIISAAGVCPHIDAWHVVRVRVNQQSPAIGWRLFDQPRM